MNCLRVHEALIIRLTSPGNPRFAVIYIIYVQVEHPAAVSLIPRLHTVP
jgi:hypothetical protein